MRRTAGLAALALAAATAAALPLTTAAQGAPAARTDAVGDALAGLRTHPGAARATDGQAFVARDTVVDADGSSHVRFDRTLDGLRVVGGDLVVHRDARRLGRRQPDPGRPPHARHRCRRREDQRPAHRAHPQRQHRRRAR